MSLRRRSRLRREGPKATIDMNSLIDLTFLLLVVFIVTLPTLEQSVEIALPTGKTNTQNNDRKKNLSISINRNGELFLNDKPVTKDDLANDLKAAVAADAEVNVLIRGDVNAGYGQVYDIVKLAKDANVKHMGLVSKEK